MTKLRRFALQVKYFFNLTVLFCREPFVDYGLHDSVGMCCRPKGHGGWHSRWPLDEDL